METGRVVVHAQWDRDADVWVATSDTIGLVTEAASMDELVKKLNCMVPELLELNGFGSLSKEGIPVELLSQCNFIAHREAC